MKKWIGIAVIGIGSIMAAVALARMINGQAFGWDSILLGFAATVFGWMFLLDSEQGLLGDMVKSAACIAAAVCLCLTVGDFEEENENPAGNLDYPYNQNIQPWNKNDGWAADNEWEDEEQITCWTCYGKGECKFCDGSGQYEHYPDWAGTRCRTCEGTGNCPGCDGYGYYR